jgi:hypothetical protein
VEFVVVHAPFWWSNRQALAKSTRCHGSYFLMPSASGHAKAQGIESCSWLTVRDFIGSVEVIMSGDPGNLALTYLRRIDTKVDNLRADMVDVKQRIGFLEEQHDSISRRIDRIGGDVARFKTRLDRVDTAVEI